MDSDRFIFMVDNDEEDNGAVEDGMSASTFIILMLVLFWTMV
jgi:flagellar basal body-associated protein FliL